jgi:hypothetical protein
MKPAPGARSVVWTDFGCQGPALTVFPSWGTRERNVDVIPFWVIVLAIIRLTAA